MTEFQKEHYLANFVQSTFDALPADDLQGAAQAPRQCRSLARQALTLELFYFIRAAHCEGIHLGSLSIVYQPLCPVQAPIASMSSCSSSGL